MALRNAFEGLSTEATLEAIRVLLATEDFASEAKLEQVRALLASAEAARDLDATAAQARLDVLATEAKLEQVRALLATNETARDTDATAAQTRLDLLATEAKLEQVRALLASSEAARDLDATAAQARLDLLATESKLEQFRSEAAAAEAARDLDATAAQARLDLLATEAKLESVRALLASNETARDTDATAAQARLDLLATDTKLEDVRALLAAVRDEQHRRTDPLALAAGANMIGYTASSVAQAVGQGRVYLSSSGRLSLGVTGGSLRFLFQNPSTSTKSVSVLRLAGFSSAGNGFAQIMLNPTAGVPTSTPRPHMNAVAGGGVPSAVVVRADLSTTAMSGGIDTGIIIGIPQNSRFSIDLPPIVVTPGVTMGINIPYTGTGDVTFSVYWQESA